MGKNRTKTNVPMPKKEADALIEKLPPAQPPVIRNWDKDSDGRQRFGNVAGFDLALGIRRIVTGQFHGLYELVRLDLQNDQVVGMHVITDANDKATLITMARNMLVKI